MLARGIRAVLAGFQGLLSLSAQAWDSSLALPGCESLAADGEHLWVFSYDRRSAVADTGISGHLYRLHGAEEMPFLTNLTPPGGPWKPFGLAYQAPYLWFLHGAKERPTEVWRFTWEKSKLTDPRCWRGLHFVSLQAIAPVDSASFYVANDRSGRHRWHLIAGFFVRRVRSNVLFCRGDSCFKVADRIPYASGLAYSPTQQRLFVSVAFRKALWVYDQLSERGELYPALRIRLPGYPDNLIALSDSVLWVVCHRRLGKWARSLAFGSQSSRWYIVEVRTTSARRPDGKTRNAPLPAAETTFRSGGFEVATLYYSPKGYGTASTAVPIGPYIYVGSVFEPYLLRLKEGEANRDFGQLPNKGALVAPIWPSALRGR